MTVITANKTIHTLNARYITTGLYSFMRYIMVQTAPNQYYPLGLMPIQTVAYSDPCTWLPDFEIGLRPLTGPLHASYELDC